MKFVGIYALPLALCVAWPAAADELVKGKIFELGTEKLLFTYENKRGVTGAVGFAHTRYLDLGEKPVVEENMLYENGKLKTYKYNQLQTAESGSIEIKDGKVFYTFVTPGKTKTDDEDFEEGMIVPDQIEEFIGKSWKALREGETVKFRLLLLEELDSIGFKFFQDKEREIAGKAAVDMVMKPSSVFIAAVAPTFRITVEKDSPHRILETVGRLPVRRAKVDPPKSRSDWKAIDARMAMEYAGP